MVKNKLLVIADDLTGALDTGVHFSMKGAVIRVLPAMDALTGQILEEEAVDVWVVNTESRHISPEKASERVSRTVNIGLNAGIKHYYKKTDSTLRGNIGPELNAMINSLPFSSLPFIPAYPGMGRYTKRGYHYLGDVLINESRFADDPLDPVKESYIPRILKKYTDHGVAVVHHKNTGKYDPSEGKTILVFDCEKELDLPEIASFLKRNGLLNAVSGSAAIAQEIAGHLGYSQNPEFVYKASHPIFVVNGSLNAVSIEQVSHAYHKGIPTFYLPPEFVNDKNDKKYHDYITNKAKHNQELVVSSVKSKEDLTKHLREVYDVNVPPDIHNKAARKFAKLVAHHILNSATGTLVVFGGDTLMALMKALQVKVILPLFEIFTGIVVSRIFVDKREINLITKPGGYGEKDTLINLLARIK